MNTLIIKKSIYALIRWVHLEVDHVLWNWPKLSKFTSVWKYNLTLIFLIMMYWHCFTQDAPFLGSGSLKMELIIRRLSSDGRIRAEEIRLSFQIFFSGMEKLNTFLWPVVAQVWRTDSVSFRMYYNHWSNFLLHFSFIICPSQSQKYLSPYAGPSHT